jgi:integrase
MERGGFNVSPVLSTPRREDGEPSRRFEGPALGGTTNETTRESPAFGPEPNHAGNNDREATFGKGKRSEAGDALVNQALVERRFRENARNIKPSTADTYGQIWRRFGKTVGVERYSLNALRGKAGKRLVFEYLEGHDGSKGQNRASWRVNIAALRTVWERGGLGPFPLTRGDLPRLPRVGKRQTPRPERILPWVEAMGKEPDTYSRVFWLLLGELGLRPSHVRQLRWGDVVDDARGQPYAIVAQGSTHDFKSPSDVIALLPPALASEMDAWRKESKEPSYERLILPWKDAYERIHYGAAMNKERFDAFWSHLERKWRLEAMDLSPSHLRHFVTTAARKAGMDEVARAYLQGHDPRSIGIAGQYDAPEDHEDLFDRQRTALPEGALGTIRLPKSIDATGIEPEALKAVAAYLDGNLSTAEIANQLDQIRTRALKARATPLVR